MSELPPVICWVCGLVIEETGTAIFDENGVPNPVHIECFHEYDDIPNPLPTCESCGVPFTSHLGLIGTCKQLGEAKARIEFLERALDELTADMRPEEDSDIVRLYRPSCPLIAWRAPTAHAYLKEKEGAP